MIVGILGQRGCGKSTLFKTFVRSNRRVMVIDPRGEHASLGITVQSTAEFRRYWRSRYTRTWRLILQPHELYEGMDCVGDGTAPGEVEREPAEVLEPYLKIIAAHGKQCLVAVDEVGELGDAWHCDPRLHKWAHYGRHRGLTLVWCARRPQEVAPVLRSQADVLYVFRMTDRLDRDKVKDRMGSAVDELKTLPQYTALIWRPGLPTKRVRTTLDE